MEVSVALEVVADRQTIDAGPQATLKKRQLLRRATQCRLLDRWHLDARADLEQFANRDVSSASEESQARLHVGTQRIRTGCRNERAAIDTTLRSDKVLRCKGAQGFAHRAPTHPEHRGQIGFHR